MRRKTVERVFERYGNTMILYQGERNSSFKGFLQHFDAHTWYNINREYAPLGEIPRGRHVLLAPYETELRVDDYVLLHGRQYVVRRVEIVMSDNEELYLWALCLERSSETL